MSKNLRAAVEVGAGGVVSDLRQYLVGVVDSLCPVLVEPGDGLEHVG